LMLYFEPRTPHVMLELLKIHILLAVWIIVFLGAIWLGPPVFYQQ
jgi:hypothetical protein